MFSLSTYLNEEELTDYQKDHLKGIGQMAFNSALHVSGKMFHSGERTKIRATHQIGHGSSNSEKELLSRMSPEDRIQHDMHTERRDFHHNESMRHHHKDAVDAALEVGVPKQEIVSTITLATELARTAHKGRKENNPGMAQRFHSLLGESNPSYWQIGHSEDLGDHDSVDLFHIDGRGKMKTINHGKLLKKYKQKDPTASPDGDNPDRHTGHMLWRKDNDDIQLVKGPLITGRIDHLAGRISLSTARSIKGGDEMLYKKIHRTVTSHMKTNFSDYEMQEF